MTTPHAARRPSQILLPLYISIETGCTSPGCSSVDDDTLVLALDAFVFDTTALDAFVLGTTALDALVLALDAFV
jgi:hypothetical protein